jgi:hypothetical protein
LNLCHATASTDIASNLAIEGKPHSHPPSIYKKEVNDQKRQLKDIARTNPGQGLRSKFNDVTRHHSHGRRVTFADVESTMYYYKNQATSFLYQTNCLVLSTVRTFPKQPKTRDEFVEFLLNSIFSDNYVGHVVYEGTVQAVLFSTPGLLQTLQGMGNELAYDGTFHSTPKMFHQLFTLFVGKGTYFFPAICVLMSGMSRPLYDLVFQKIAELVPNLSASSVIADFEKASRGAFRSQWPGIPDFGCWFHYSQNIEKRLRKESLMELYDENVKFKKWVRCLKTLPLLPHQQIVLVFNVLVTQGQQLGLEEEVTPKVTKLLIYIRKEWLKPRLLPTLSVYKQLTKTNNNGAESWHSSLKDAFPRAHPKLWGFTKKLNDLLADSELDIERLAIYGRIGRLQKNNARRQRAEEQLENGEKTALQFLLAVAKSESESDSDIESDSDCGCSVCLLNM